MGEHNGSVSLKGDCPKMKTPLPYSDNKIVCGICGEKFDNHEMTGKTRGVWFVICCEECRKKEEEIGEVVYEPEIKGRLR